MAALTLWERCARISIVRPLAQGLGCRMLAKSVMTTGRGLQPRPRLGFRPNGAPRADERTLVLHHADVSAVPLPAPIRMGARMDGDASRRSEA
jgi:hypothetical protein